MFTCDEIEVHHLAQARLRRIGQRYTAGKRAVVEVMVRLANPVSIDDFLRQRPGLPQSSVYRHLADLQAAGIASRIAAGEPGGYARFELAEDITGHHHHLVCKRCGCVTAFTPSPSLSRCLQPHLDELASAEGFALQGHRIEVLGLCRTCQHAPG